MQIHTASNELRLWMHSNDELLNLKHKYVDMFAKQIRQERFNMNRAIELMYNLKTRVQSHYNKSGNRHISIHKEQLHIVQKELLASVLFTIYDRNRDIQNEALKIIMKLESE